MLDLLCCNYMMTCIFFTASDKSQILKPQSVFCALLLACVSLQGIGKTLNPSYNFSEVATPYAQDLLQLQDGAQQGFVIEQLQQQATEVGGLWGECFWGGAIGGGGGYADRGL
jgi:hypothetical protein